MIISMACAQESQNTTAFYQQWQRHLKNYGILVIAMTTLQLQNQNKQTNRNQGTPPLSDLSGHDFKGFNGAWHGVLCKPSVRPNLQHPHDTVHLQYLWESELVLCSSLLPMACIVAWEGWKQRTSKSAPLGPPSKKWRGTNHGLFYFESSARLLQSHTRNLQ